MTAAELRLALVDAYLAGYDAALEDFAAHINCQTGRRPWGVFIRRLAGVRGGKLPLSEAER